ncbi:MAG: acylphosphatase [Bacteroidia bacterium]|nr:acylphosphatase [Bacteroidia bacterium]
MTRSYKINIHGKVQGVGYRYNAQAQAHKLNLTGFVRNEHDGSVLAHAEGDEEDVNKFIEWCNTGPRYADVSEVMIEEQEVVGYQTFEIKR